MDTTATRPPEQTYFPGMKPTDEPDVESVKEKIYAWLNAKVEQKRAGEATKEAHAEMLASLAEAKLDWHPYLDPYTQKKRRVWIAKEPKAKTTGIPKPPSERPGRGRKRGGPKRDVDVEIAGEPKEDNVVEMRRVPRKVVEKEIDGFASVRERMEASKAEAAKQAETKAKRGKGKGK